MNGVDQGFPAISNGVMCSERVHERAFMSTSRRRLRLQEVDVGVVARPARWRRCCSRCRSGSILFPASTNGNGYNLSRCDRMVQARRSMLIGPRRPIARALPLRRRARQPRCGAEEGKEPHPPPTPPTPGCKAKTALMSEPGGRRAGGAPSHSAQNGRGRQCRDRGAIPGASSANRRSQGPSLQPMKARRRRSSTGVSLRVERASCDILGRAWLAGEHACHVQRYHSHTLRGEMAGHAMVSGHRATPRWTNSRRGRPMLGLFQDPKARSCKHASATRSGSSGKISARARDEIMARQARRFAYVGFRTQAIVRSSTCSMAARSSGSPSPACWRPDRHLDWTEPTAISIPPDMAEVFAVLHAEPRVNNTS